MLVHVRRCTPRLRLRVRRARRRLLVSAGLRRVLAVLVVGLIGAWLGLLAGGRTATPVGPVDTQMSARLAWGGDTVVRVGPLGSLTLDTHDGPIGVTVSVEALNVADARQLFENPAALEGLQSWIGDDVRAAIRSLVIRSIAAAAAGGVLLGLLVFHRQFRRITFVGATALTAVLGSVGVGGATWNPRAIAEPRYTGLLTSAPSVVGDAQNIVSSFSDYSHQLAKLVTNVSKLYDVTSTLPTYQPEPNTIRVLHVADIHLNPAAWEVIASIAEQFAVQVIVDSGDVSDHGSKVERRFLRPIHPLKLPYVWVRGNHDSADTQAAIAVMPNAVVLDYGQIKQVAGLRFIGTGDPRFTPDRSVEPAGADVVAASGKWMAKRAQAAKARPDLAVAHDPVMAEQTDGAVPLVLAGHGHQRQTRLLPLGTRLFEQGSTGGAGLRALQTEEPTPMQATVLYFDAGTKRLQAWDDITLGGLGLTSAQINRSLAPEEQARLAQARQRVPRPQPQPSPSTNPTPG